MFLGGETYETVAKYSLRIGHSKYAEPILSVPLVAEHCFE